MPGNEVNDSLLCSSNQHSENNSVTSAYRAGDEVLDSETRQLMRRVMTESTEHAKPLRNESEALSTMKRVVNGLVEKYKPAYNGKYCDCIIKNG